MIQIKKRLTKNRNASSHKETYSRSKYISHENGQKKYHKTPKIASQAHHQVADNAEYH